DSCPSATRRRRFANAAHSPAVARMTSVTGLPPRRSTTKLRENSGLMCFWATMYIRWGEEIDLADGDPFNRLAGQIILLCLDMARNRGKNSFVRLVPVIEIPQTRN